MSSCKNQKSLKKWCADDGSAAGDLKSLRAKLDNLDVHEKAFGYNVKPAKCQLIVKENRRDSAIKVIEGTNITIVDGFRVLGSVIGTPSAWDKYMESEIEKTATLTEKQQDPATQREFKKIKLSNQKNSRSIYEKGIYEIEKKVRQQLRPSITAKNHITDDYRNLFALPLKMGQLVLLSNTDFSRNFECSQAICDPLENSDPEIAETEQTLINRDIKAERKKITLSKKAKNLGKLLIRK